MATVSSVHVSLASCESRRADKDGTGKGAEDVPCGAAAVSDNKERSKTAFVSVNESNGCSVFGALPPWTHFFFSRRHYRSLPVAGVITAQQLSKVHNSAAALKGCGAAESLLNGTADPGKAVASEEEGVPLRTPTANGNAAAAAPVAAETPASSVAHSACVDAEDEGYQHLLHDTLVVHGGVSDLQYFLGTDEDGTDVSITDAERQCCAAESTAATSGDADTITTDVTAADAHPGEGTRLLHPSATTVEEKETAGSPSCNSLSCGASRESPGAPLENSKQSVSHEQTPNTAPEPPERTRAEEAPPHVLATCRVSRLVCGHKGVAHGGFIATLLDNAMGYLAVFLMPRPATKSLTVNYLKPLLAGSLVLVEVTKVDPSDTSSCAHKTPAGQAGRCSGGPGTPESTSRPVEKKGGSGTATTCFTLRGKVYSCIPDELRAAFPGRGTSRGAPGTSGRLEPGSNQHRTQSEGPPDQQKDKQRDESNRMGTDTRSSTNDGTNACSVSEETNGVFTEDKQVNKEGSKQTDNSNKRQEGEHTTNMKSKSPGEDREATVNGNPGGNAQQTFSTRTSADALPPGVWLVATAEAVFVDVSAKWKSLT